MPSASAKTSAKLTAKTSVKAALLSVSEAATEDSFSGRLRWALQQKGKRPSPVHLEREFNLRWRGTPVTANSVRKWLWGMSIPTLDKQRVLAQWLGVAEDWLRWGNKQASSQVQVQKNQGGTLAEEQSLLQDYRLLSPTHQRLTRGMMEMLLKEQGRLA